MVVERKNHSALILLFPSGRRGSVHHADPSCVLARRRHLRVRSYPDLPSDGALRAAAVSLRVCQSGLHTKIGTPYLCTLPSNSTQFPRPQIPNDLQTLKIMFLHALGGRICPAVPGSP